MLFSGFLFLALLTPQIDSALPYEPLYELTVDTKIEFKMRMNSQSDGSISLKSYNVKTSSEAALKYRYSADLDALKKQYNFVPPGHNRTGSYPPKADPTFQLEINLDPTDSYLSYNNDVTYPKKSVVFSEEFLQVETIKSFFKGGYTKFSLEQKYHKQVKDIFKSNNSDEHKNKDLFELYRKMGAEQKKMELVSYPENEQKLLQQIVDAFSNLTRPNPPDDYQEHFNFSEVDKTNYQLIATNKGSLEDGNLVDMIADYSHNSPDLSMKLSNYGTVFYLNKQKYFNNQKKLKNFKAFEFKPNGWTYVLKGVAVERFLIIRYSYLINSITHRYPENIYDIKGKQGGTDFFDAPSALVRCSRKSLKHDHFNCSYTYKTRVGVKMPKDFNGSYAYNGGHYIPNILRINQNLLGKKPMD